MRDLEIRGAGNLLGPEQSGHIAAVGFELYCQLLRQSVGRLKGGAAGPPPEVQVRLDFLAGAGPEGAACLPSRYITEPQLRIEMYRKLARAADARMLEDLRNELRDRFGPPPGPAELALKLAGLKIVAAAKGVTVIETKEDKLMLQRNNQYVTADGKFPRLRTKAPAARLNEIRKAVLTL